VLPPLTWQIFQIIVDCFLQLFQPMFLTNPMVIGLLVILHFAISTSLKFKEENQIASFENVMDDDSIVINELSLLTSNIRREVINVIDSFLSFLHFKGFMTIKKPIIWSL